MIMREIHNNKIIMIATKLVIATVVTIIKMIVVIMIMEIIVIMMMKTIIFIKIIIQIINEMKMIYMIISPSQSMELTRPRAQKPLPIFTSSYEDPLRDVLGRPKSLFHPEFSRDNLIGRIIHVEMI